MPAQINQTQIENSFNETLKISLNKILRNPGQINAQDFNSIYNFVYSYCTLQTKNYLIRGDEIYFRIEEELQNFTEKIEFLGSCKTLSVQILNFKHSVKILSMFFSYLERFYIKTSILNCQNVKTIKDLFYYKIYYNFIYKIEVNILGMIFLEIDTLRTQQWIDLNDIKTVINFYLECLARNGLETNMNAFYKRYVNEFKNIFDFKCPVKSLVKKIHIEIYISSNIFRDSEITKEIIKSIMNRKDEIMKLAFHRIENFEKFKHIFVIINKMPDYAKNEFTAKYDQFLFNLFSKAKTFDDLFNSYRNVQKQIKINKMTSMIDLVDQKLKNSFLERSGSNQIEIYKGVVEHINKRLNSLNMLDMSSSIADSSNLTDNDSEVSINFFCTILDERLMDFYVESVQQRLVDGFNPQKEYEILELILEKLGLGLVSKLKISIEGFQNKFKFDYSGIAVSMAKITKGLWEIKSNNTNLHPNLKKIAEVAYNKADLKEKQKLEFNYKVSPVICKINDKTFKMSAELFSIYLYISENNLNGASTVCNQADYDKNLHILQEAGLIDKSCNILVLKAPADSLIFDLFRKENEKQVENENLNKEEDKLHIVESKICSLMKKKKFLSKDAIYREIEFNLNEIEEAIESLISKGYLEIINEMIHYIP